MNMMCIQYKYSIGLYASIPITQPIEETPYILYLCTKKFHFHCNKGGKDIVIIHLKLYKRTCLTYIYLLYIHRGIYSISTLKEIFILSQINKHFRSWLCKVRLDMCDKTEIDYWKGVVVEIQNRLFCNLYIFAIQCARQKKSLCKIIIIGTGRKFNDIRIDTARVTRYH